MKVAVKELGGEVGLVHLPSALRVVLLENVPQGKTLVSQMDCHNQQEVLDQFTSLGRSCVLVQQKVKLVDQQKGLRISHAALLSCHKKLIV